jgi:hypothetical protein
LTELELFKIKKLWKWRPEFSGPPMIELVEGPTYHFELQRSYFPIARDASIDDRRSHFELLEAAWDAARARAQLADQTAATESA